MTSICQQFHCLSQPQQKLRMQKERVRWMKRGRESEERRAPGAAATAMVAMNEGEPAVSV